MCISSFSLDYDPYNSYNKEVLSGSMIHPVSCDVASTHKLADLVIR